MGDDRTSVSSVREVLLGRRGPYADPRVATDALDNLDVLVAELDGDGRALLAASLLALVVDNDPVVASGAAIGCDRVHDHLDAGAVEAILFSADGRLDQRPVGFTSARSGTIRGEVAFAAVRSSSSSAELVERVVAAASPDERSMLVGEVADRWPALVMWRADAWVGRDDSGVLARLGQPWQRIAVASAVRPWSAAAVERMTDIGRWRGWHPLDVEALQRVMRDEAPELVRPDGLPDHLALRDADRWWIVAEEPWAWALWRRHDGVFVMEELPGGWSMLGLSRQFDDDEVSVFMAGVLDADGPEPTRPHR